MPAKLQFVCDTCADPVFQGARGPSPKPPFCYSCREKTRQKSRNKPPRPCVQCSKLFPTERYGRAKYCSQECKRAGAQACQHAKRVGIPKPAVRNCANCESVFQPSAHDPRIAHCSERCRREINWAKRNAARRITGNHRPSPVSALRILERDGWKCQFCRVKTPKRLRGTTHPNAPEVDHILPLSKGGTHVDSNLQCLCRKCNSEKSAEARGQLSFPLDWISGHGPSRTPKEAPPA